MNEYGLIDLHIHTAYSHEARCNDSVRKIFEMAQAKTNNRGGRECVISITDHNTMLGCLEARKIIESGEFDKIKFINGMEFTVDVSEIDDLIGMPVFERCHILAYNFDENNKEIQAYSRLTHIYFSDKENVGIQFCAGRRAINEHFNINIPFVDLLPLTKIKKNTHNVRDFFVEYMTTYLNKHNMNTTRREIASLVSNYIDINVKENNNADTYGRLKLTEVFEMVKNAGGELVLAHPSTMKVNNENVAKKFKIAKLNGTHKKINLMNYANSYDILDEFFARVQEVGVKLSGVEKYAPSSIFGRLDMVQDKLMEKYGLYATAGSDFHGDILSKDRSVGSIYTNEIEDLFKSKKKALRAITLATLPCVGHFIYGQEYKFEKPKIIDGTGRSISSLDLDIYISSVNRRELAFAEQERRNQDAEHALQVSNRLKKMISRNKIPQLVEEDIAFGQFKQRVRDLSSIPGKLLDKIIKSKKPTNKKVESFMEINKFARSVYEAIKIAIETGKISQEELQEELNRIKETLKQIKTQYDKIASTETAVMKGVFRKMENAHGSTKNYIEIISKIDIEKL